MSDAQISIMEIVYHVRRMRILESYTSLIVWLLCAAWAYVCFCTEGPKNGWLWLLGPMLILVAARVWLQMRWARRTPDEQQAYMQENNIDVDQLNAAAAASRKDAAGQQLDQKKLLKKSALWAIPVIAVFVLVLQLLFPGIFSADDGTFSGSALILSLAEGYLVVFCILLFVMSRVHRK